MIIILRIELGISVHLGIADSHNKFSNLILNINKETFKIPQYFLKFVLLVYLTDNCGILKPTKLNEMERYVHAINTERQCGVAWLYEGMRASYSLPLTINQITISVFARD